jgi:hypothetical protein
MALGLPDRHTATYLDPRLGASYAPNKTLVFRTSYTVDSTFPDLAGIERLPASYLGYPATSIFPSAQSQALLTGLTPYNGLKASHVNAFDLGGEKGFDLPGFFHGAYRFGLDGFRRVGYDLIQADTPNLAAFGTYNALDPAQSGLPIRYTNAGKSHASGYDLTLAKRLVHDTDMEWSGFVTYTHLVSKATAGNYNTNYEPFYAQYLSGTPGVTDAALRTLISQNEVQTSWDQTHTVQVVANKRYLKFLMATILLDAGSGYPYSGATANEFTGGFATNDAQHSSFALGGATFHQVPVVTSGNTLQATSPIIGQTGWHYKFTLNNDLFVAKTTSLFLNIDNVFNRKTVLAQSPTTAAGQPFYSAPSAAYPQGLIYYGNSINLTPRFVSFGIRTRF